MVKRAVGDWKARKLINGLEQTLAAMERCTIRNVRSVLETGKLKTIVPEQREM